MVFFPGPVYTAQVFTSNAALLLQFGLSFNKQQHPDTPEKAQLGEQVPDNLLSGCVNWRSSEPENART